MTALNYKEPLAALRGNLVNSHLFDFIGKADYTHDLERQ
jgi:hypothetical protein